LTGHEDRSFDGALLSFASARRRAIKARWRAPR